MVHHRDENLKRSREKNNGDLPTTQKFVDIIHPEWTIDDDGIPYCTQQTYYQKIIDSQLKKQHPQEFEKMLHCHHCEHYTKDDCYFPKAEIDKIELDRNNLRIRCQLCGMKIDRLFSILMSMYYKSNYGVTMPVICCACYASLENNTFEKNSKRRMILFVISLITSLFFFFNYFLTFFNFKWFGFLFFLVPFSFWGYISIRDIKNIYYLHQGRKFYDKIMNASEQEEEKLPRKDHLDDDDKKKPSEGAFYSPGYDY